VSKRQIAKEENQMNTISNLMNNFNGISLAVIMILSYCAVLKNTKRNESATKQVFNRNYQ
jgi:heme/copper-type cytochrome/quinol oxidase subunit 2